MTSILDQLDNKETWTSADGTVHRIDQMDEQHVRNVIALLIRCAGVLYDHALETYMTCEPPRGEMAQDAFDAEVDALSRTDAGSFVADSELMNELQERLKSIEAYRAELGVA